MGSQSNVSIGGFLAARGMNKTVFKSSLERTGDDRATVSAPWNPGVPFDPSDPQSFAGRYGFLPGPNGPSAGSLSGERVSDSLLLDLARDPSNPLDLINNTHYQLQPGDHEDVEYGSLDGTSAVWDSFFAPALSRLFPDAQGPVPINAPNARDNAASVPPQRPPETPSTPGVPPRDPVLVPAVSPQVPNPFTHKWLGRVPYSRMVHAFGGHIAWPFEAYVRQHQGEEEVLAAWLHRLDGDPKNAVFQVLEKEFDHG
jgi:hypothetical protein